MFRKKRIRDFMRGTVLVFGTDTTVVEAAKKLTGRTDDFSVIVDGNRKPVGILTLTDLVRHISKGRKKTAAVADVMMTPPRTMDPDLTVSEALKIIDTERLRKYPVVEREKVVGFITQKDVIDHESDTIKFHRTVQNGVILAFVAIELFVFFMLDNVRGALG